MSACVCYIIRLQNLGLVAQIQNTIWNPNIHVYHYNLPLFIVIVYVFIFKIVSDFTACLTYLLDENMYHHKSFYLFSSSFFPLEIGISTIALLY